MIVEALVCKTLEKVLLIDSVRGFHYCSDKKSYQIRELRIIRYSDEDKNELQVRRVSKGN